MERIRLTIAVTKDESVSAILTIPQDKTLKTAVITAHGMGNDMDNELLVAFTDGLAAAGYPALQFNFPYKEKGLKASDSQKKLEDTWTAVCHHFQKNATVDIKNIIAAGKSMGGRIASQLVAEKRLPVEGLIFLGYPLHPANDQSKIRDAHLYQIKLPMLFFAGTRDNLCNLAKLQNVLSRLSAPRELEIIEGGDHSFHVPKSMGITESEIYKRIVKTSRLWIEKLLPD